MPTIRISLAWLAHAKALAGVARRSRRADRASSNRRPRSGYVPAYHLALAHTGLGNRDAAFGLLEKACTDRDPSIINLSVEPRFEPLRRDPRYGALLQQLRLPEYDGRIGIAARSRVFVHILPRLNFQLNCFDFHGFRGGVMTARRIVVAVLAVASLTIGIYAQGGGGGAQGGGRAGGGGGRAGGGGGGGRQADAPQPGNLITGAWGEQALTPDSRGWGWMVKSYLEQGAQRPLWNQAKEKLLKTSKVTSVTISSFQPEHIAKRESTGTTSGSRCSTHAVVQRSAEDDRAPARVVKRRCADDPHARCARSQHPEGDRPRRAGHRRADG